MSGIDVKAEAYRIRKEINDVDIRIASYSYTIRVAGVGVTYHDYKEDLIAAVNELTTAEATKADADSITKLCTNIVTLHTKLAGNGCITETANLRSTNEYLREEIKDARDKNGQFKKDNAELVKEYAKVQAKFEYVSEQHEKLLEKLVAGYKKGVGQ